VAKLRVNGPGKAWEEPSEIAVLPLEFRTKRTKKRARERKISIQCNPRKKKYQKQEYKMPVRD